MLKERVRAMRNRESIQEGRGGGRRVVIVSPGQISGNPRVVKEADALTAAGFRVRVIFPQSSGGRLKEFDFALLREKAWSWATVPCSRQDAGLLRWGIAACRQRINQRLPRRLWPHTRVAERADGRTFSALLRAALQNPADLYIGHYPEGLAVAGTAAIETSALLGFDAEDFHTGEPRTRAEAARIDFIERRYLSRCTYITAASPGIAAALEQRYNIRRPVTIYNTFSLNERLDIDGLIKDRLGQDLSLYWYSQTIGLDRGIQDAIKAAGLLGGPVQIHLRGTVDAATRSAIRSLAQECGVADRVHFHSQVAPSELLSRTAEHDVGLALEQGGTLNRSICTTNKLFFYLLAGLAVAATRIPGQEVVLSETPIAAPMYDPGDVHALARILENWRVNRTQLDKAKAAALASATARWNWDQDRDLLVETISRALSSTRGNISITAATSGVLQITT